MQISKQTYTEIGLAGLFLVATIATYLSVAEIGNWVLSLLSASFWGILWVSAIGWYAALEVDERHTPWFVMAHVGLLFSPLLITRSLTPVLVGVLFAFACLFGISLFAFLRTINREVEQRIIYYPRRIVFPYIGRLIVMIMLLASMLVYFQVLDSQENTEGFEIPERVIQDQISIAEPVITMILPEYQPGLTVQELVESRFQAAGQSEALTPEQRQLLEQQGVPQELVQEQIQSLEDRFNVDLEPSQSLESAITAGLNAWVKNVLGNFVGPIVIALASSFLVFIGLASLIPVYMLLIKAMIMLVTAIMTKTQVMQTRTEETTRTTYIF